MLQHDLTRHSFCLNCMRPCAIAWNTCGFGWRCQPPHLQSSTFALLKSISVSVALSRGCWHDPRASLSWSLSAELAQNWHLQFRMVVISRVTRTIPLACGSPRIQNPRGCDHRGRQSLRDPRSKGDRCWEGLQPVIIDDPHKRKSPIRKVANQFSTCLAARASRLYTNDCAPIIVHQRFA